MSKENNLNEEVKNKDKKNQLLVEETDNVGTKKVSTESNTKQENILVEAENSVTKFESPKEKKNRKRCRIIIITLAIIFAIFILFGVIVCINKLNDKVYKNVYLFGQNISGMSKSQVEEIINVVNNEIKGKKISIYQDTEEILTVTAEELNIEIDVAKTLKDTFGFGRVKNIFANNFEIIMALVRPVNIEVSYKYDDLKLDGIIKNIDLTIKDRAVDDTYSIDEEHSKLIITRGKPGNSIDYNVEKDNILDTFKNMSNQKLVLNIQQKEAQDLDLDKVYNEVKREAKDAYVDESSKPIKFIAEVVGLDFDKEELKQVLNKEENKQEGKVIEFPLKVTEPSVKLKDITSKYYNDKISGKTTYFNASQVARATNLSIALKALNGKIVMPGEIFSYNDAIGDTTAAKGYMPAATFKGGTVVDEMGGGICQTTSTLYDAVLMANLEIVERHQHRITSWLCTTKPRCYSIFSIIRF